MTRNYITSLWSNLTESRVKEITPQSKCRWLEKNRASRPQTSSSSRTAKRAPHLQLNPDNVDGTRPTTAHEDKRKKRTLSISRSKLLEEAKKDSKASGAGASIKSPEVPTLPTTLSPNGKDAFEELVRPGTAITTDGSVAASEIFELPADGLPSPRLQTSLPSPRSPSLPASPGSHLSVRSQDSTDAPSEHGRGLRKRSSSTASGKPRVKRASWFMGKNTAVKIELPPPLPPPTGPPPPIPLVQPFVAELPASRPAMSRSNSSGSTVLQTPVSPAKKTSLDSDSILNAFPSVPAVTQLVKLTSDPNTRDSASLDQDTGAVKARCSKRKSQLLFTASRSRPIAIPLQNIDGLLAPDTGNEAPKHDSKQLPPLLGEATATKNRTMSFSEELQQEYDRLMEVMGEHPSPGTVVSVIGEFDYHAKGIEDPQKFSNEEALSKLEFGILK